MKLKKYLSGLQRMQRIAASSGIDNAGMHIYSRTIDGDEVIFVSFLEPENKTVYIDGQVQVPFFSFWTKEQNDAQYTKIMSVFDQIFVDPYRPVH